MNITLTTHLTLGFWVHNSQLIKTSTFHFKLELLISGTNQVGWLSRTKPVATQCWYSIESMLIKCHNTEWWFNVVSLRIFKFQKVLQLSKFDCKSKIKNSLIPSTWFNIIHQTRVCYQSISINKISFEFHAWNISKVIYQTEEDQNSAIFPIKPGSTYSVCPNQLAHSRAVEY